ncbi:LysR substrate-binding domain-containing protein [Sphingosinicella rhizophila]|uniref:LysR substrate-binding domain-containing protein n=1 Tax=Sphingosinicella rhizophila TaxID=3050082 RepID=A0ABU3Q5Y4_9SPHN|nr:LysR substrate-binding domain-containing protein [Sphingosinicella sp. GR2756]MDT9598823.1 LysR substrate-binding domain-containing protein [Sphingosinicella sp. GR2756]
MRRALPSLDWIRVFAETASTESFSMAAERLCVSPGAVSQRIKSLEAYFGLELFTRHPQGVELTAIGRRYAQQVLPALDILNCATREVASAGGSQIVRLTAMPALAQLWLGPRMNAFYALHPHISVEIWADGNIVDLRTSQFDVALRHGKPPYPGCTSRQLFVDELVAVASPALLAESRLGPDGLIEGAAQMVDSFWADDLDHWLGGAGISRPAELRTEIFSLYSMVIDATVQGRGFMIGHSSLIHGHLRRGELQLLSPCRVRSPNQFHLLTKSAVPLSDAAASFVDWVTAEAGAALDGDETASAGDDEGPGIGSIDDAGQGKARRAA